MLRWTPSGAVKLPDTVQFRVAANYPDRLLAGAPEPSRCLDPDEVLQNIQYFTTGLQTPRTQPCTSLVLSGHGVATRSDIPNAIESARRLGMRWIVLHAGPGELVHIAVDWMEGLVNRLVLPVHSADTLERLEHLVTACRRRDISVVFAVDLRSSILPDLPRTSSALDALKPAAIVFTWPFPIDGHVAARAPDPDTWQQLVTQGLAAVQDTPTLIRGLPLCYLPEHTARFRRTSNRWYVDAAHQQSAAMLFLPDVVKFDKSDACRFCAMDHRCDGFFDPYLDAGHAGLRPM